MRIFKLEFRRIILNKISAICLLLILIATLNFVWKGVDEYQNFTKKKTTFLDYEKKKVGRYVTYGQYYALGFRMLYSQSPLVIFFKNSLLFQDIESNIDAFEIIKIYTMRKGQSIIDRGEYKDFAGIIFIFGTLYMFFMGLTNSKNDLYSKTIITKKYLLISPIIRLVILNLSFIVIFFVNYLLVRINGISFSKSETNLFIAYCLYALLFLTLSYILGLFTAVIFRNKKILTALMIWFVFIFIIPETNRDSLNNKFESLPSNESLNLKKLEILMDLEKEAQDELLKMIKENKAIKEKQKEFASKYLNEGFVLNEKNEKEFNESVSEIASENESQISFFPFTFYKRLTMELSSKGFYGYFDFLDCIIKIRKQFIEFYVQKRYTSYDKEIEPFVKNNENVFQAKSHLPKSFWKATSLTALYTIILFIASFLILKRRLDKKKETLKPDITLDEGHMYYLRCKDDHYMDMIYHHYENQPHTACLDQVNGQDIDPGVSLPHMTSYFCKLLGANKERTFENLEKLGITDLEKEKRTPEIIKKIYCAVSLAVECDIAVIKNFIYREPREFERQFLGLLKYMMEQDTIIIYLGTEPPQAYSTLKSDCEVDKYEGFKIDDPLLFILR